MDVQLTQRRWTNGSGSEPDTHPINEDADSGAPGKPAEGWDSPVDVPSATEQSIPAGSARPTDSLLPVSRFSPAPGLTVDHTGNSVVISGRMELHGSEASGARAASIEQAINTAWTHTFADGASITCRITVRYRAPGSAPSPDATQIEATRTVGPCKKVGGRDGPGMRLNANEPDAFTWAPTHEFGHVLGMRDRYAESLLSKIRGEVGLSRTTAPLPHCGRNVMAETGGTVGRQNVADLAAENAPSPYWIHDDDEVAAWVFAHPPAEIGTLPTADKLRAIRTLQGGWISERDLAAMGRICASVTSHEEAEAIRRGVDLLQFTDLGQRTRMRVFLARMP